MDSNILSTKTQKLQPEDLARYLEKIKIVDGVDPYCMRFDAEMLPLTVDYDKIFAYLISKLSFRSGAPHKNVKSLDAYKTFQSGFVREVKGYKHNQVFVVFGKVLHSMSVGEAPAECWIIVNDNDSEEQALGTVLAAHCDCTAGAGETCSHVSAILYALSYAREICLGKHLSVTELPSYWIAPAGASANADLYKPIETVDFGRKRLTTCDLRDAPLDRTEEEYKKLIDNIVQTGQHVAASGAFFLRTDINVEEIEIIRCRERLESLSLQSHFNDTNVGKSLEDLVSLGKSINWTIDASDCFSIEEMTRKQHAEPLWFKLRYGRVTASIFHRCTRTSL
ncbi:uncharacterized protein LOC131684874 [Topomyia yanbarensis]|nr:uncharacterized protein LOC131684874 [Topomyia yanbarensis]